MKSASSQHRLEITAVWKGTVLAVEHLEEGQRFTLGSGPEASLPFSAPGLDDRVPFVLAEVSQGVRRINLPPEAVARYMSPDGQVGDPRVGHRMVPHPELLGVQVDSVARIELVALDADPALAAALAAPDYRATPERLFRLRLESFDWNCPRHITPRFTAQAIAEQMRPLQARLAAVESDNALLRARLAATGDPS